MNLTNLRQVDHAYTSNSKSSIQIGKQLKKGWCDNNAIVASNVCSFLASTSTLHELKGISIACLEYIYPVVYSDGTVLLKTPMQLLIEAEYFEVAEILLNKGVFLPDYIKEDFFKKNELDDYLKYLSLCSYDLFIEYHQLKKQEKHSHSVEKTVQFISKKSQKITHSLEITSDQLLSMIREKYWDNMSEKSRKWLDNKIAHDNALSFSIR